MFMITSGAMQGSQFKNILEKKDYHKHFMHSLRSWMKRTWVITNLTLLYPHTVNEWLHPQSPKSFSTNKPRVQCIFLLIPILSLEVRQMETKYPLYRNINQGLVRFNYFSLDDKVKNKIHNSNKSGVLSSCIIRKYHYNELIILKLLSILILNSDK